MNCLLYARVSTDKQAQKDLSIPAQIAAMTQYAKTNGWKVAGHFIEEGETARNADRPELKNLLHYCKEHKDIDAIIVHKLDRFARNLVDHCTIKAILKQRGIRLVSVSEPFDDNPVGHLLENIMASIAEWYSANLGEEVKKSNTIKLQRGEWPHKPPLGYKSVRNEENRAKHVPNPDAASLVHQAFELFATGRYSLATLSEAMYERGLQTKTGRMFGRELMKKMLRRRFYIGQLEWQGKIYKGIHEPIISAKLFYRVQEVLKTRSVDTGEKGKWQFLLRGVTYCSVCGQRLTAENHPRGSYYRCVPDPRKVKCDQPYTPVELLDGQLEALYERLQPPKHMLEILKVEMETIAKERESTAERDIKRLSKTISDIEVKELKLLDEMLAGKLDRSVYEKMQMRYTEQKDQAEARLSQMQVDYRDPLDFLDKCIVVASCLLYLHQRLDFEGKKKLIKAVFERIEVADKAIVSVKLNPPFSILLGDDIDGLFEDRPTVRAKGDIFEQIVSLSIGGHCAKIKSLVLDLAKQAG
jgi:site-specific DNA recombinase